jgi:hypothetical protein
MSETTKELKAELEKSVALLRTLRDEAKVKLHLAGMEAKDQWRALEPRVQAAVDAAKEATDASHKLVTEAVSAVKKFHASLR